MDNQGKDQPGRTGVTRRGFLGTLGAGAVGAVAMNAPAGSEPRVPVVPAGEPFQVTLSINGRRHTLLVEPRWTLLFVLRERLQLTGTKPGCERGECGACTVLVDGQPRYACMMLAAEAEGRTIETVEGLLDGDRLGAVQQAFRDEDALQCGYCTPGQIMAAEGLLRRHHHPDLETIRHGMSGNLCRCGAYAHIFKAVARAADLKDPKGGRS